MWPREWEGMRSMACLWVRYNIQILVIMRRKIIKAPQSQGHKVLQAQSGKLKEKLQALKQQIQQKKKEKEISKNQLGQSGNLQNSSLSKGKSVAQLDEIQTDLGKLLGQMHMEHLLPKLSQRNIHTLEELRATDPEVLDQWKDIPVGYRIKLKKQLNNASKNIPAHSPSPNKRIFASSQKQKNIQDIVQVRKKEKVFVALPGQQQQNEQLQDYKPQLSEYEQEEMIKSLMNAFQRTDDVEEIKLEPINRPKVVLQPKEAWGRPESFPDYKYCWSCLKKMNEETIQKYQDRQFCGPGCLEGYKSLLKVQEDQRLFTEIEETENRFAEYLKQRKQKGNQQNQRSPKIRAPHRQQQQEVQIDFELD